MGKIRIKTLGLEEEEKKQQLQAQKRREAKKIKKEGKPEKVKAPQGKGGERMKQIEVSDEDLEKMKKAEVETEEKPEEKKKEKAQKKPVVKAKKRGKKYTQAKTKVKKDKGYQISEAIKILKNISYSKFDETVELHLNVEKSGIKGETTLPHSTGKKVRVAVADEKILEKIESGKIDFDVLISTPTFMPRLVKFAKILGPKGLMPTPKAGTVAEDTKAAMEKFSGGSIRYKTEAKAPIIHQAVGKLSYKDKDLLENIEAFVKAVDRKNILSAYLSATMTPSVKLELSE